MSNHLFQPSSPEEIITIMRAEMQLIIGDATEDMIIELAPMFLTDIPPLIEEAEVAITTSESGRLKEIAHTLKGSSGSMGIRRFSQLCFELEQLARENNLTEAALKLTQIQAEFQTTKQALSTFISSL